MTDVVQVKRIPITPELRDFVFNRDGYVCRYCGSKTEPFHLDHVYPVSKGGETSTDNLVTSCSHCNSKKHAKVGIYPKPIGYFEKEGFRRFYLFASHLILGALVSILFLFSLAEEDVTMRTVEMYIGFICWAPALKDIFLSLFKKD